MEETKMKPLDRALMILEKECSECVADYEEAIELWIIGFLKILELKCLIHSIFPFLYTTAVSEKLDCLREMTERNKK